MIDRERIVAARIDEVGHESFPDNEDSAWRVLGVRDVDAYCFVEADATPALGYPRFRFVLRFETESQFLLVGCYAWIDGRWALLFTTTGAPMDWQALAPR